MKTAKELISELNDLRKSMKRINDFSNIQDWLNYNSDYAKKHNNIMHQIESLSN